MDNGLEQAAVGQAGRRFEVETAAQKKRLGPVRQARDRLYADPVRFKAPVCKAGARISEARVSAAKAPWEDTARPSNNQHSPTRVTNRYPRHCKPGSAPVDPAVAKRRKRHKPFFYKPLMN